MKLNKETSNKSCQLNDFRDLLQQFFQKASRSAKCSVKTNY